MAHNNLLQYPELDHELPDKVSEILSADFWIFNGLDASMLGALENPVKFSSTVSIYVTSGEVVAEIDLIDQHIKGPCIVNISPACIMLPKSVSQDFKGKFIVLSQRFTSQLLSLLSESAAYRMLSRRMVTPIDPAWCSDLDNLYSSLTSIQSAADNPCRMQALLHTMAAFFYASAYRWYDSRKSIKGYKPASGITERFLALAREHFRSERFLDFYAEALNVTPKHLSRTVKQTTGYTACEWIDRYVVLEAKVLLRSSSLTIQQISEELNFSNSSWFCKFFKRICGMAPREFRNS